MGLVKQDNRLKRVRILKGVLVILILVAYCLSLHIASEWGKREASQDEVDASYKLAHGGQLDEAIARCRHAVQLDPNNADAHNNLGFYLFEAGQLKEAEAECREAVHLAPDDGDIHDSLGQVLSYTDHLAEAVKECREAVRLDPSKTHRDSLDYAMGLLQSQKNKVREIGKM